MNNFQIFPQPDPEAAAAAAGEALNNLLLENSQIPILLLLSGGSAFSLLDYVNAKNTGEHLTVAMLDERFSADEKINNFAQLQKTDFYALAFAAGSNFFGSLPRPGETLDNLARRMENNLRQWHAENPKGIILATLGMGPDGHTAGIFPFPENPEKFRQLFESQNWTAAYDAQNNNLHGLRITATVEFFKLIDFGLVYVCGEEKEPKLKELLTGKILATNLLPANAWHEVGQVKIFTDLE